LNDSFTVDDACNIVTGKLDSNQLVENGEYPFFTCAEHPSRIDNFAFDDSAILIAGNNANGNFHVNRYSGKFNAYQRTYVLTAKDGYSLNYVYYALKLLLRLLKDRSHGSQTKFLTIDLLKSLEIRFRLPSEQEAIATILSDLDDKIGINNRINEELQKSLQLLYEYWFVQFDFPSSALQGRPYRASGGDMRYSDVLKREIPKEWDVGEIATLCELNCRSWSKNDYPSVVNYVDLSNVHEGKILDIKQISRIDAPSRAQRILQPGDTIVGTVRPGNNSFACIPNTDAILTGSTGFAVLTPKKKIYREFNYIALVSRFNIKRLVNLASGAAYPAVDSDEVAKRVIPLPPEALLRDFHRIAKSSFDLIEKRNVEITHLARLRDWLLPMLINGQVKVA